MLRQVVEALKRHFGVSLTASGVIGVILGAFVSGPIGDAGSASINYLWGHFFPPSKIVRFDFNASRGCSQGKLADIRKLFEDAETPLEHGAEMLFICDTQSMSTVKASAARDLAVRFPGCLQWRKASLVMLRKSEAICALPGGRGFVCDGAKGRQRVVGAVGEPIDPVSPCSINTLRRFDFQS